MCITTCAYLGPLELFGLKSRLRGIVGKRNFSRRVDLERRRAKERRKVNRNRLRKRRVFIDAKLVGKTKEERRRGGR